MACPTSVAATAESTPPESAHKARSPFTSRRTRSTISSIKDRGNQFA